MLVDVLIVFLLIAAALRGREIGLVRQLGSALGFGAGILLGVWLQPHFITITDTTLGKALLSLAIVFSCAIVLLSLGEYLGFIAKRKLQSLMGLDRTDGILGALAGGAALLVGVWLLYPMLNSLPDTGLQRSLQRSAIVGAVNESLPDAPTVLSGLGHLINPNGFPDVFAGLERAPNQSDAPLPDLGSLQAAVTKARPSVVKLEGRGCGGIVEGSGYIAADGIVVTNAHVVAGVGRPTVIDQQGRHQAQAIWFDPDLDLAVLRVDGLAGQPLQTKTDSIARGTPAVVAGYPGGGGFAAKPATVLDQFNATGRNIYGQGTTDRNIYELKADIIPGNSGGPLLDQDGAVIGLIFAQSTTYDQIGYALTMKSVAGELNQAMARNQTVSTSRCAE